MTTLQERLRTSPERSRTTLEAADYIDKLEAEGAAFAMRKAIEVYKLEAQVESLTKPLTVQEVEQILAQHNYELHGDRARYIVRMTEQAHGVKPLTDDRIDAAIAAQKEVAAP